MPEGHTIHRAALDQRPMLVGHRLDKRICTGKRDTINTRRLQHFGKAA